jgi:hypothetical protein
MDSQSICEGVGLRKKVGTALLPMMEKGCILILRIY